jgi:catechol-2,3-dioxygenase
LLFWQEETGFLTMKKDFVEIVVRVNDLDGCRIFYREVLQLGDPVLDSSFIASFRISESTMLTLEKTDAPFLEHAGAATLWRVGISDLAALRERMQYGGYELKEDPSCDFWRGTDPEGNVFLVYEAGDQPAQ